MRYIRTDIGIFESEKRNQNPKMFECLWGSILKEADTIEELCDEFVVYHKYENNDEYYGLCAREYEWKHAIKGDVIYGAIWTDKGLIYVAKMNNKGKLELI